MPAKNWLIDRRTCLRGLGAALSLPLLEAMGWAETPKAGGAYKPPVRLGFIYMPLGVWCPDFWPTDPKIFPVTLPRSLEPLRPVIDQCLILDGIDNVDHGPVGNAAHAIELSSWLTATLLNVDNRANVDIATSADQVAAKHIGLYTALPSLELAYQGNSASGTGQEGVNNRYYTTGSFRTPTQPLPVETSPAAVLKRLFSSRQSTPQKRGGPAVDTAKFAGGAAAADDGQSLDRSMLDLVLGGAKTLRARVGVEDQRQLDDYLDTVRSLETRVAAIERQQAEAIKARAGAGAKGGKSDFSSSPPIEVKVPGGEVKWSEHVRLMGDLMVLAFQTDVTRVVSLMTSHPQGVGYPELGFSDGHHDVSHHDQDADKIAKVQKIDTFNITQFAYIIARMKALKEGPGTLLDNSIMMWGSGQQDGNNHSNRRLPSIIAGKGGGTIRTGRYVPKCNGNHGDLLTAILARAGVPLEKPIGIGTKLLPDLS